MPSSIFSSFASKLCSFLSQKRFFLIINVIGALCLFGVIHLLFFNRFSSVTEWIFYVCVICCFIGAFFFKKFFLSLYAAAACLLIFLVCFLAYFSHLDTTYRIPPHESPLPFGHEKVLIIVPHEDDDMNLAACIFPSLAQNNDVHVLFTTNGDRSYGKESNKDLKALRLKEAMKALSVLGVQEDHVLFLGYGDCWMQAEHPDHHSTLKHWYHAPDDFPMMSESRETHTYGLSSKPCVHPGTLYTKRHFEEELKSVIESVNPSCIICIDYDSHHEHRALSLIFDKVMGKILKENEDYKPTILRSFAYSLAWNSEEGFFRDNLASTRMPYADGLMDEVNYFIWSDRLRMPSDQIVLTRTLVNNPVNISMNYHRSQMQGRHSKQPSMIKGDKVFWWRPTENLALHAQVTSDIPNADLLNDFKLGDSLDIYDKARKPFDYGWLTENAPAATATFTLKRPSCIRFIRLFSHPSPNNRISHLTIRLSNGKEIIINDLPPTGTPVNVQTGCDEILSGFSIIVDESHGKDAGLTEVEAYETEPKYPYSILKMQDEKEDFIYDYTLDCSGSMILSVYSSKSEDKERVHVCLTDNAPAQAKLEPLGEQRYRLTLPIGESCVVQLKDDADHVIDAAYITHPTKLSRFLLKMQRLADRSALNLQTCSDRIIYSPFYMWKVYQYILRRM